MNAILEAGARWTLPASAGEGSRRHLYFFKGGSIVLECREIAVRNGIELQADRAVELLAPTRHQGDLAPVH